MNTTCKRLFVPGAFTTLAAMALVSAGQDGNGGNGLPGGVTGPTQASVPGTIAGISGPTLVVMSRTAAATRDAYRVTTTPFSSTLIGGFSANGSGMSRQPGTRSFFVSGGMTDGGNLYTSVAGGPQSLVGATGWTSVPGLAFDATGALWGSAAVSVIGDGLISIDATTGAGTLVGGGYGGPGGIDAIAHNPADGTMYASTGFFYDGSPGDVITIDTGTGLATDTGIDMNPLPPTVVGGMAFASNGMGYVSIGNLDGGIWEYDTSGHTITLLGTVGANSATDIEVVD